MIPISPSTAQWPQDRSAALAPEGYYPIQLGGDLSYSPGDTLAGESFSRASIARYVDASGVVQSAGSGVKRDGHYVGAVRTVLLEPARTNVFLNSEDMSNAQWTLDGLTVSSNATAAPDGTSTADKLIPNNGATAAREYTPNGSGYSSVIDAAHSISFFAKAAGFNWLLLRLNTGGAAGIVDLYVNAATGAIGTVHAQLTVRSVALASGWYRFEVVLAANNGGVNFVQLLPASADLTIATGDGTSGVYVWGMQMETSAAYCTSYIPTAGITVARAADSYTLPGEAIDGATLHQEFYNLASGHAFTATDDAYTSEATIPLTTGRAYTLVELTGGNGPVGFTTDPSESNVVWTSTVANKLEISTNMNAPAATLALMGGRVLFTSIPTP